MSENNLYTYQAMFILDNQEVRKGFTAARDWVKATLEKHGVQVRVLRLWGERKLAYTIRQRSRATYLLGWLEAPSDAVAAAKRDFYLVGPVFRVLFLREEEIPAEELAFGIEDVDESALQIPADEPDEPVEASEEPAPKPATDAPVEASEEPAPKPATDAPAEAAKEPAPEPAAEAPKEGASDPAPAEAAKPVVEPVAAVESPEEKS